MPQARVFVIQEPLRRNDDGQLERKMNLAPAMRFGELVVLAAYDQPFLNHQATIALLREKLADYGDSDYLLLVGAPTLIGWATAIAAQVNQGRVRALVWDREERAYIPVSADVSLNPTPRKEESYA